MPIKYIRNRFPRTQNERKGSRWAIFMGKYRYIVIKVASLTSLVYLIYIGSFNDIIHLTHLLHFSPLLTKAIFA